MDLLLSVITPASRGVKELTTLLRDFKNQTLPKNLWEHLIVFDGIPPQNVTELMQAKKNSNTVFTYIEKDTGDMKIAPGTRPRNHGITLSRGKYVCFFDDDDRAKDTLCETFLSGLQDNMINVCQMSCQESRQVRGGDPTRIRAVPEVGIPVFPVCCHVGTPCFCLPRAWALEDPWRHEPEHDFRFIKRICEKHQPTVRIIPGIQVDVDSLMIGGLRDWVSIPPFYRGD